jgi:hypothetical protein
VDGPLRAESFLFVHCTVYLSIELRVEVITLRTGPAVKVDQLLCSITLGKGCQQAHSKSL